MSKGSVRVVRKDAVVAQRQAGLAAEFGAEGDGVPHRAGRGLVDEVGLVERVLARRVVLIGVQRKRCLIRRYRAATERGRRAGAAGIDVLVAAVVVGIDRCRS